jgi:hypothetical protein
MLFSYLCHCRTLFHHIHVQTLSSYNLVYLFYVFHALPPPPFQYRFLAPSCLLLYSEPHLHILLQKSIPLFITKETAGVVYRLPAIFSVIAVRHLY